MSNDDRLYNQLDKMDQRLDGIDRTLVKNTVILDEHIKRTALLEEEIKPMKKHMSRIDALVWVFGVAAGALGALLTLKQLGLF